jgi:CRISPR/Cas system-associated exonuclease Cas4 (RecB family)
MIKEALHAYVTENQRPFTHDRTKTIGSSEIGQCARKLWFLKHAGEKDQAYVDRWGAQQRGNLIEVLWTKALRDFAGRGKLHFAGRYQRTFFDDRSPLSATPDGILELDGEELLLECKSIDPRAKIERIKPEHEAQVQVAMGILNSTTRYRPQQALVSYIDASFLDEVREFRVPYDAEVFENLRARANAIMAGNSADAIRPEGVIAGGQECEYCPFRSSCSALRAEAVPERNGGRDALTAEQMALLRRLAYERQHHAAAIETIEQQKRQAEQAIKDILRAAETRRVEDEFVRIVWSALKGRPSWDWPKLRAAAAKIGLDLAEFETVGNPSDRLEVRVVNGRS